MGLHQACKDCSILHYGSVKLISPHKLHQRILQLKIIKISLVTIIWSTQELGNVLGPKGKYLIIHSSLVVPLIHFQQGMVELSNLWKGNLLLQMVMKAISRL